jgi:hypothetical protein
MKSISEFDILCFPNNLQLEMKNSNMPSLQDYSEMSNFNFNKKYNIKNKIPTDQTEKCASTGLTVKILKNVKNAQERVFMDLNNSGLSFVQNQNILDKIKLTNHTQNNAKILENNDEVGKNQHEMQKKNLIPGMKRK